MWSTLSELLVNRQIRALDRPSRFIYGLGSCPKCNAHSTGTMKGGQVTHRWRSGARLGFMCFLLSAMAFGVPAFAVTSHDVNGVYHGIYREDPDYHHVWTEHFGNHGGDWDPNAYVDLTSDGGAAGGAC